MSSIRLTRRPSLDLLWGYGVALVVLAVVHVVVFPDTLNHTAIEVAVLGGLAVGVLGYVARIARADLGDETLLAGVAWWCAGGSGLFFFVAVAVASYVGFPPASHEALFVYQVCLSLGAASGLVAGFHEARAVTEARESARTEAERRRLEYLNHLLRHDVLNNLSVVEGNLELALDEPEEAAKRRLETARRQTRQATEHIQNVRALVRAARDERSLEPVDLSATVAAELAHIRESYPSAVVESDVPPDVVVRADGLLGSVVENLVRNAVQHNDAATPRVTVAVDPGEETVALVVSDDGPGIPPDLRASLFAGPGDDANEGGLGLHLVETLVSRYGGSIAVRESDGEGTTFVVELDRA